MKFLQKGSQTIKSGKRTKPIDKPTKKDVKQVARKPAPQKSKVYPKASSGKRNKTPGTPSSPRGQGGWLS